MSTQLPSYSPEADVPGYTPVATSAGTGDALPSYDDSGPQAFIIPPELDSKLPEHFRISGKYLLPQVFPSDLFAHLTLLGAFHRLREEVRTQKGKADINLQPDEQWAVFLERAVYRFERWATMVIGGDSDAEETNPTPPETRELAPNEVPPLDVLMVWHTYMLNPRTYYEDTLRKLHGLLNIGCAHSILRQCTPAHARLQILSIAPIGCHHRCR